ncbi:GlxA family transcriptional regulator [Litoreibacter roseus]|uniref:Transcriptional regulator n=1 Tax=Litoreibacter roseus TaxID=2601869 RepID=A0A6N6JCV0_9RHOB|nr:DJ-1/PfpI family protein [Litoreibacter roseus]GFE63797.1 transcriptional regulator [Litoreibacter roseus]
MDIPLKIRTIDVLLFDGVNLLDVAGPVQAFEAAHVNGRETYSVRFISTDGAPVRASCGLKLAADGALSAATPSDDLLIPGGTGVDALTEDEATLKAVKAFATQAPKGRLISVCSGALVLAAAGLLDGRPATTHWSRASDARTYKNVLWDLDRISISTGRIYTSAGVTTGIDLALSIIREDCGPATALAVARELVVQLHRTGGQSQFATHLDAQFAVGSTLTRLIEQVVTEPKGNWSLENLANAAGMNPRTLSRHFKRDLQETPAQFVERVRVEHARGLLSEDRPLKQVAIDSGFGDLQRMRRAFQRRFGIHVSDYVSAFG